MRWISGCLFASIVLAILTVMVSAPFLSTGAYANKMNGKCSSCSTNIGCKGINSPNFGKKGASKTK